MLERRSLDAGAGVVGDAPRRDDQGDLPVGEVRIRVIGRLGTLLGENGINIGTFNLGRLAAGGEAVLLLSVDSPVPADVVEAARKLPGVKRVMALAF